MFTRFQLQYLIFVNSRAQDLPKYFLDLDPELHFKLFKKYKLFVYNEGSARMEICYSNSLSTLCSGFKNVLTNLGSTQI